MFFLAIDHCKAENIGNIAEGNINVDITSYGICGLNGKCVDGFDSFKCNCTEGFTGTFCNIGILIFN